MPIPLPNLDDRTYADLTAQAQALIPALHPAWTNYNPSDPGIVLIELLAWLTEMLMFQVNQIPPPTPRSSSSCSTALDWARPGSASLEDAIRQTDARPARALPRSHLRRLRVAGTECLASRATRRVSFADGGQIRRVRCVPTAQSVRHRPGRARAPRPRRT